MRKRFNTKDKYNPQIAQMTQIFYMRKSVESVD
jgi:hypothetical protein